MTRASGFGRARARGIAAALLCQAADESDWKSWRAEGHTSPPSRLPLAQLLPQREPTIAAQIPANSTSGPAVDTGASLAMASELTVGSTVWG